MEKSPVLVVGAGLAGMTCAQRLASLGVPVTVLDKGRRFGGRMSTRVSRSGPVFDQGAQYFAPRSVTFQQKVAEWVEAGHTALWDGRFVDLSPGVDPVDTKRQSKRYVGVPGMGSIVAALGAPAERLDGPHFETRVTELRRDELGWHAIDRAGQTHGAFGRVVVAIPPPQARALVGPHDPDLDDRLDDIQTAPTWTTMLAFPESLGIDDWAGAFVDASPLSHAVNNSAKPGRPAASEHGECWVLHGSIEWSKQHLEDDADAVSAALREAFGALLGRELPTPSYAASHRWRYGHIVGPDADRWLLGADGTLGVCGDSCTQGSPANVERAWLSGLGLGEYLADA
jgi:predicted NAD/FAD-dependent oxidoreductase